LVPVTGPLKLTFAPPVWVSDAAIVTAPAPLSEIAPSTNLVVAVFQRGTELFESVPTLGSVSSDGGRTAASCQAFPAPFYTSIKFGADPFCILPYVTALAAIF
jgi:hypothetical protein